MFDPLLPRSFVAVVEEGEFTRAANRLHLTHSAVSGHLRKLEEEIGKPLLLCITRFMELTPDGEILIGYAGAILKLNQDVNGQLLRTRYEGIIRIGVSEDFAQAHMLQLLQDFAVQHEGARFYVQVGPPGMLLRGPLPLSQIGEGMRVMEAGLPGLPDVHFMLFVGAIIRRPGVGELADALIARCKERATGHIMGRLHQPDS